MEPAARTANGDEETTPRRRDALTDLTKANNFFHRHALARCEVTGNLCDVCGLKKDGPTAMQRCKACNFDVCPECVERMAEASDAEFLLQAAVVRGDIDAMTQLLDGGAAVDQARGDGATPLYIACEKGHVDAARLLLERGAALKVDSSALCEGDAVEVRYRGREKYYPGKIRRDRGEGKYDIAYDDGEREKKVDTRLIRKLPLSPLAIAEERGHSSIVALLEEHQK